MANEKEENCRSKFFDIFNNYLDITKAMDSTTRFVNEVVREAKDNAYGTPKDKRWPKESPAWHFIYMVENLKSYEAQSDPVKTAADGVFAIKRGLDKKIEAHDYSYIPDNEIWPKINNDFDVIARDLVDAAFETYSKCACKES